MHSYYPATAIGGRIEDMRNRFAGVGTTKMAFCASNKREEERRDAAGKSKGAHR